MMGIFNFKKNSLPENDLVEDQKKRERTLIIVFGIFAIIFFNLVMYYLTKI